ncbi:hypothetical protein BJ742DRAFT_459411 [Cladochytrium replicatum]|nr:hypothetical protein BJ742DRAFT_459411 [Cladochytrium replicatum]
MQSPDMHNELYRPSTPTRATHYSRPNHDHLSQDDHFDMSRYYNFVTPPPTPPPTPMRDYDHSIRSRSLISSVVGEYEDSYSESADGRDVGHTQACETMRKGKLVEEQTKGQSYQRFSTMDTEDELLLSLGFRNKWSKGYALEVVSNDQTSSDVSNRRLNPSTLGESSEISRDIKHDFHLLQRKNSFHAKRTEWDTDAEEELERELCEYCASLLGRNASPRDESRALMHNRLLLRTFKQQIGETENDAALRTEYTVSERLRKLSVMLDNQVHFGMGQPRAFSPEYLCSAQSNIQTRNTFVQVDDALPSHRASESYNGSLDFISIQEHCSEVHLHSPPSNFQSESTGLERIWRRLSTAFERMYRRISESLFPKNPEAISKSSFKLMKLKFASYNPDLAQCSPVYKFREWSGRNPDGF